MLLATPGVKSLIFGLIIIFFIIYEPMGLDGRWMKMKTWVTQFRSIGLQLSAVRRCI